jgi:hypothetical protein
MLSQSMLVEEARQVLDRFDVPARLQHVRQFVWREGTLRFKVEDRAPKVYYELEAHWPTARLRGLPSHEGLEAASTPVIEGRWVRGTRGYLLRIGIDLAVPSGIAVRSRLMQSFVPFVGRPAAQVELALQTDLDAYVQAFLSTCRPVAEARAADQRQLPNR